MPPKKAKEEAGAGEGKPKPEKKAAVVDAMSVVEMSKEQLEDHIFRLKEEMDREREERNFFQLERDKIATFWEISKHQLEDIKAELRNRDREIEEIEERHQVEIRVYKQKIKHLLYEHQNNLSELRAAALINVKLNEQDHLLAEQQLNKDKRELKIQQKEEELSHVNAVKELKLMNSEKLTELRLQFEKNLAEIEDRYDKKMRTLRDELDLRRKTELHEVEERKNLQINNLMKNHEKAFTDIKNYYNDITVNNLALINTLKEQAKELKKHHDHLERQLNESSGENRKLTEQYQQTMQKVVELKKELEQFENTRTALAGTKSRLKQTNEELKTLNWEQEVTELKFKQVQHERDEIYSKFVAAIQEVQQKSTLKNLLLEKKLAAMAEMLEKKDAQLSEILATCNLDPSALDIVSNKFEDILNIKNETIKDLQTEIARVTKVCYLITRYCSLAWAHDELLNAFETRLKQYGVRSDDLGFVPLDSTSLAQQLGAGSAGLVSKCPL